MITISVISVRECRIHEELDVELWKLGITAKTEHNEAAPLSMKLPLSIQRLI